MAVNQKESRLAIRKKIFLREDSQALEQVAQGSCTVLYDFLNLAV